MKTRSLLGFSVVLTLFAATVVMAVTVLAQSQEEHVAWVADELTRMQTIRPGMTRAELLRVFTTEGGLSNRLRRTFVSRNCPYFKVDVEFRAVGRPETLVEDERDVIVSISRPYLQFRIID